MTYKDENIRSKPSQLVNLKYFVGVLIALVLFDFIKDLLFQIPSELIPEKLEVQISRLPKYAAIVALLFLGYQILKVWCTHYEITTGELKHTYGIFHRRHDFIELYRVKDFHVDRPLLYRIFGLGNLRIYTSDKTSPEFRLVAIRRPQEIYNILRERVEQNRREKHVFEVD
ncbi:MAG: PH domain-containing protein [Tangfeifania sp.]